MSIADTTFTGLSSALQGVFGRAVTIRRGSSSTSVTASIGHSNFEIDDGFGVQWVRTRDFLIKASDYAIDASVVEPDHGDEIDEVRGTVTHTYRVRQFGDNPVFHPSDGGEKILRVHTDRRSTA